MTDNVLALSSAAMVATQAAVEQFMLAAAAPTAQGYRLLYITQSGCGTRHSYENMRKAERLGVTLQYVNFQNEIGAVFIENGVRAPGQSLRAESYAQAQNYVISKGLEVYDSGKAVLIAPNGQPVHVFSSTQGDNFLRELQRYLPPAHATARGAQRS